MTGKNALLKVVIIGDGGVGKTCLMRRYVNNRFEENSLHTIGVEFTNKEIEVDGKMFTLQIWDTAGQERFKSLRTPFYRGSDLCLLVFSVGDKESFKNLGKWKDELVNYADIKDPINFPFVVLANKVDLPQEERQVATSEGTTWCLENGDLPYVETSAKDATNVDLAFVTAMRIWSKLEEKLEKIYDTDTTTITLTKQDNNSKMSNCCSAVKS